MKPGAALLIALSLGLALPALAAPPAVTLRPVASGLSQPVELAHAGDGSGRLFIVEQAGTIKILKNGAVLATPFLDITSLTDLDGERGLLGLAFHPQYAANRRFYVFYTRPSDGALRVSEFLASASNPDLADAGTERSVITIPHASAGNHNGGRIAFGPQGYLYIATGDGGGGGDPSDNGQNRNALLGKLLRIDVNTNATYLVPPTNPFVGQDGADEVWAYGLRNPWKFTFDRRTGDLFIADVGQGQWEEINFEPAGDPGGRNYGWDDREGAHCFEPMTGCLTSGRIDPIIEFSHASGGRAVIGGYVYRGTKSSALRGFYVYGDLNITSLSAAFPNGDGSWSTFPLVNGPGSITAFGEDEAGELYVVGYGGGLYALDGAGPAAVVPVRHDFNGDGKADVLWRNATTGENYLYPMNGTAILGTEGYLRRVADLNWKVVGIGDFDGDGRADILWRNSSTGENYLYFMDGTTIKPTEGYIRAVADQNWKVAGVGDFDGDGKADILWRNSVTGQNYLYPMDGLTIKATEGYLRTVADTAWQIVGVGEFDGDGKADILWRNSVSGENYLYPMDGTAIKPTEGYLRTVADLSWQVAGIGDYNGDGKSDILWRNGTTGENYLYPMDGRTILGTEGYLRTVMDQSWQVKGTGDYDGDGKADVLWRNSVTGENYIYPMDGTSIKPTEGYLRTVADANWRMVGN